MTDMTADEVKEWKRLIRKVSYTTCLDFPNMELDDMMQEVWLALMELQAKGLQLTIQNNTESTLRFAAKLYATRERKEHLTISVQYAYRTKDVRKLFSNFFDKKDWMQAYTPEDAASELGAVQLELMGDVARAWDRLPSQYKAVIFRTFALKDPPINSTERVRLSHALGRCADIMNSYQGKTSEVVGTRRVISNARARVILDTQWDDRWFDGA